MHGSTLLCVLKDWDNGFLAILILDHSTLAATSFQHEKRERNERGDKGTIHLKFSFLSELLVHLKSHIV